MKQGNPLCLDKSRWLAYAAASAASVLTGGHSAEAAIHYSGLVNVTVSGHGTNSAVLPLDQPGDSLHFVHNETFFAGTNFAGFRVVALGSLGLRRVPGTIETVYVSNLARGESITHGDFSTVWFAYGTLVKDDFGNSYNVGEFKRGVGYIGFYFNGGAGRQYGWARVKTFGAKNGNGFKIIDYAWADHGEPIVAGQKSEEAPMRPEEESLGALAFGAAGVIAWRKAKAARAAKGANSDQ